MTRVNTNVSSLTAQNRLQRTNSDLQTSLTRLSTGLRINSGKDDPAGLIASESLRSDITSINKALTNTQRANQIIGTADSALGQVSSLLNDVRGLVVEAANNGGLSESEIAANQLQVDSSLEAINRISQTTTFQGRRLLDGSLDFNTTIGGVNTVSDLRIDSANLGSTGAVTVDVNISAAATQGQITVGTDAFTAAAAANTQLKFAPEAILTFAASEIKLTANDSNTSFEGYTVNFTADSTAVGAEVATYTPGSKTINVRINSAAATTAANVAAAINTLTASNSAISGFTASVVTAGAVDGSGADAAVTDTTDSDRIDITAASTGADFNGVSVKVASSASVLVGAPTASYDSATKQLLVTVNNTGTTTLANIATAVNNLAEFNATATGNGDGNVLGSSADVKATATTGTTGGVVLKADLVVEIGGKDGSQSFTFKSGASADQLAAAISLLKDSTGVSAVQSSNSLVLKSTAYGKEAKVTLDVISEGAAGTFKAKMSSSRATGTDIAATVNGINANGKGNALSINTASLSLSLTVTDGSSKSFKFDISGGGAQFQLGPTVTGNQQARLGIGSINTARLGGSAGRLFELGTGNAKSLANDAAGAARVVDQVIEKVTGLRGRLGAFQRTTLDSNSTSLNDSLLNLNEAQSSIRDADFAKESANLTRAQILVQSGTSVLGIANQSSQSVLSLLR
ncbi:MAG: flagellin [Planctomycetota bacterium]|nr:flagellin [Planctomycetota bacterium]